MSCPHHHNHQAAGRIMRNISHNPRNRQISSRTLMTSSRAIPQFPTRPWYPHDLQKPQNWYMATQLRAQTLNRTVAQSRPRIRPPNQSRKPAPPSSSHPLGLRLRRHGGGGISIPATSILRIHWCHHLWARQQRKSDIFPMIGINHPRQATQFHSCLHMCEATARRGAREPLSRKLHTNAISVENFSREVTTGNPIWRRITPIANILIPVRRWLGIHPALRDSSARQTSTATTKVYISKLKTINVPCAATDLRGEILWDGKRSTSEAIVTFADFCFCRHSDDGCPKRLEVGLRGGSSIPARWCTSYPARNQTYPTPEPTPSTSYSHYNNSPETPRSTANMPPAYYS